MWILDIPVRLVLFGLGFKHVQNISVLVCLKIRSIDFRGPGWLKASLRYWLQEASKAPDTYIYD